MLKNYDITAPNPVTMKFQTSAKMNKAYMVINLKGLATNPMGSFLSINSIQIPTFSITIRQPKISQTIKLILVTNWKIWYNGLSLIPILVSPIVYSCISFRDKDNLWFNSFWPLICALNFFLVYTHLDYIRNYDDF